MPGYSELPDVQCLLSAAASPSALKAHRPSSFLFHFLAHFCIAVCFFSWEVEREDGMGGAFLVNILL